jgi:hypothetical protein
VRRVRGCGLRRDGAATAQQGREGGHRRQRGGHHEHDDQAVVERRRDELREVFPPGEDPLARDRQAGKCVGRREQVRNGIGPSTAANRDETGGREPTWWATAAGTPWLVRPLVSVLGRLAASPAIISEKNTPIDRAVPEFWKVERMPEAAPRSRAGTLPMIEEELGAPNILLPIPLMAMSSANAQ